MTAVPRHAFLDSDTSVAHAYADEPVLLKRDRRGAVISTMSQPTMIATMLEELEVRPGSRVLEVGTASGYNAALLGHLTGRDGVVVSLELEPDLSARARRAIERGGFGNVRVICADGRGGWAAAAPYDGIIVTAGASKVEPAWERQLRDGGRLVVPMDRSGLCFTYQKRGGELVETSRVPAGFVPLRAPDVET